MLREYDSSIPWYRQGKCYGDEIDEWLISVDPSPLYFPDGPRRAWKARTEDEFKAQVRCAGCPVKQQCQEDAIAYRVEGVIQGGYAIPNYENELRWKEVMQKMAVEAGIEGQIGCSECHKLIHRGNWRVHICDECKAKILQRRADEVARYKMVEWNRGDS